MSEKLESKDSSNIIKLHVGGISKELVNTINDLEERFAKVGRIIKPFEIHEKPILDYYFGFITMKLDTSQFRLLKKSWNDVRFKGSKLKIAIAKDDYMKRWEKDSRSQDLKQLEREKREKVAESRLTRIKHKNDNPFDSLLVTKGRIRKTPRKTDLKNLTMRITINGRLKIIKCKKTKLWGVDKNKSIRDLTSRFVAGEWRDGNDHVIDRLSDKILIFSDSNRIIVQDAVESKEGNEIEEELNEEKAKSNKLLEKMLNSYNFDKPVELEDDNDLNDKVADFDYELEHSDEPENDEELALSYDIPVNGCVKPSRQTLLDEYNEYERQSSQQNKTGEVEQEDDDDDDEFYKTLKPENEAEDAEKEENQAQNPINLNRKEENKDDHDEEYIPSFVKQADSLVENSDNDDEFIPTFGAPKAEEENKNIKTNTTEKLRALLSTADVSLSSKVDDDSKEFENSNISDVIIPTLRKTKDIGLFFPHFDSPFLVAQSQINRLREVKVNEELQYDEWFFKNRGELNREFRRLRKDLLRRNKKKSNASTFI
ncbi:Nucleolar protein 8 [Pichia californica]|uniref:Nucleolar protein 8 n=1 Tax=Pichia californica TaxID=460514 RepID=A0A9P6WN28_9ASCO|nr:Nucleolar protein 8 [[Candida] californica]KAG0688733.1 Nucleolar protein 8 [[Candida] californica]